MADIAKLIEEIKSMSVLELNSLVKAIEKEFGVSAAAVAAAPSAAPAAAAAAPAAAEQTEFTVVLKAAGANKIGVIKVVRELTSLGLVEAKALVDGAPKTIKENISKDEAHKIAEQFKAAGAEVEIK